MKALTVVLVAAGAGVAYLWWRDRKAASTPIPGSDDQTKTNDVKTLACEGLAAASLGVIPPDVCQKGISVGSKILDAIGTLNNRSKQFSDAVAKYDADNLALNGKVAVANEMHVSASGELPFEGSVLEFENGCQPFKGAPGWSKCAPGTHDMRTHNLPGAGDSFYIETRAATPPGKPLAPVVETSINGDAVAWGAFRTGSVIPKGPDPTTSGPVHTAAGEQYWFRGKRVTCPAGQAPGLWDANGNPIGDHRTGTPACAPGGVSSFVPDTAPPPPSASSPSSSTHPLDTSTATAGTGQWVTCPDGVPRWQAAGASSPCPTAKSFNTIDDSSLLAVTNGGLAQRV